MRLLAKKTALTVILVLTTSALGCSRDGSSLGSVAAAGSDAREAPDATSTDPGAPPFNYIPLNDKACVIEEAEEAVVRQAVERIEEISATYTNEIGGGFELCSEENKNGCPACDVADNKMLAILRTLDGFVNIRGGSAEAYFREALRYPYRHLSVSTGACADLEPGSCPAGSETNIVLTQSRSQPCADGAAPCDHYSIESESLDGSCLQFPMSFYGADEGGTLVANLHEQTAEDVAFGFIVPFVRTLPEKPDRISEAELIEFLNVVAATKDRVDVRVWNPTLTISGEAGARCGVLRGWVDKQTFVDAAAAMDLSGSVLDAVEAVLKARSAVPPAGSIAGLGGFRKTPTYADIRTSANTKPHGVNRATAPMLSREVSLAASTAASTGAEGSAEQARIPGKRGVPPARGTMPSATATRRRAASASIVPNKMVPNAMTNALDKYEMLMKQRAAATPNPGPESDN